MQNKETVDQWLKFAEMDSSTAIFLYEKMYPKPLEIICYHCEQAAEKSVKALLFAYEKSITKTHDLGLLLESLSSDLPVLDEVYNACDDLTPFGVKVRYPQEIQVDDDLTKNAIHNMQSVLNFCNKIIKKE